MIRPSADMLSFLIGLVVLAAAPAAAAHDAGMPHAHPHVLPRAAEAPRAPALGDAAKSSARPAAASAPAHRRDPAPPATSPPNQEREAATP